MTPARSSGGMTTRRRPSTLVPQAIRVLLFLFCTTKPEQVCEGEGHVVSIPSIPSDSVTQISLQRQRTHLKPSQTRQAPRHKPVDADAERHQRAPDADLTLDRC